jgi:hypothetical protein
MSRALCLLLCFSSLVFGQSLNSSSAAASSTSSPVQVLYVFDGSTVITYNIDPQTLDPIAVGTTTMPTPQYFGLVTSPDGRFLYDVANLGSSSKDQKLYVYDTDANGVPGNTPLQAMDASRLGSLAVNPSGTLLYSVTVGPPQQNGTTRFAIVRHAIDPATGKLSQRMTEATYTLDTYPSGNDCGLSIVGFNRSGTTMYDAVSCSGPHASGSLTYYERSVDSQTGALGPDQQIYAYGYYAGSGYANVQIKNNLLFAFVTNDNQGPNADDVDVYQITNSNPTVSCTASMWAICGDFASPLAHPSGEYVFLEETDESDTEIGQVNLQTQQITQVNSLTFWAEMFSPDGKIVYGSTSSPYKVHIAGFDAANGDVTPGGTIRLPRKYTYWSAAERY